MTPEIWHCCIFAVYSLFFLCLAFVLWRKKKKRSYALKNHNPCAVYLRMRFETAKVFESEDSSCKDSRFNRLKLKLRYVKHCITKSFFFLFLVIYYWMKLNVVFLHLKNTNLWLMQRDCYLRKKLDQSTIISRGCLWKIRIESWKSEKQCLLKPIQDSWCIL